MLPSSGYKTKKVLYPDEGSIAETSVKTLLNSVDFTLHRDFNLYITKIRLMISLKPSVFGNSCP